MASNKLLALVYQVGIANVFDCAGDGRGIMRRVYQGDYRTAENIVRGALLAGAAALVYHADVAGDCQAFGEWHPGAGDLWAESKHPPSGCRIPSDVLPCPA